MGAKVRRTDFEWVYTEEPHASRRKAILEKYPEIRQLFGCDPNFKWAVSGVVLVQLASLPVIPHLSWPMMLVAAYCFGGVLNHSLMLAIHDIGHNQAFGHARPLANRLFGILANIPIGVPCSISFRKYHVEHHKWQGVDAMDPDLPSHFEAKLFNTTVGKLVWVLLLPIFYIIRPLVLRPLPLQPLEVVNIVVQMLFNACVVRLFAHFISEHYMFEKGFETYSYYGPLNFLAFNFGYHMEHHDFPAVPASRLPEVKRIAAEFYEDLPYHTNCFSVLYHFITDSDKGVFGRIKRNRRMLEN